MSSRSTLPFKGRLSLGDTPYVLDGLMKSPLLTLIPYPLLAPFSTPGLT
jgi:hypothetical protein